MSVPALADTAQPETGVGWFGKLPVLGDFASRRLPPAFVELWDGWLQRSIAASRQRLGERWLDVYLTSPIWRFALLEHVSGADAWAGVMMPSVDRVGRYFPFTLATPVATAPADLRWLAGADAWYDALEALALRTLDEGFGVDDLELGLAQLAFPNPEPLAGDAAAIARWWNDFPSQPLALTAPRSVCAGLAEASLAALASGGEGRTLWWARAQGESTFCVLGYPGLPPENEFATMMTVLAQA